MIFKPRPYQTEAINIGIDYFKSKKKQRPAIMVEPVGAGKSLIIGNIASKLEQPTIVLQPSKELLEQNYNKLLMFGGQASIFSAYMGIKEIGHITYATLGSIKKLAKDFKDVGVENVIIDECHYGYSPQKSSTFIKFMKELNPKRVLGFTATPIRLNSYGTIERAYSQLDFLMKGRKGAPAYFKDIIHLTNVDVMVNNSYWSPLVYETYDFDENILKLNSTGADYTTESISQAIAEQGINNNIYKRIKYLIDKENRKRILVFVDSVASAETFVKHLNDKGYNTALVSGKTNKKDRNRIVNDFKNGIINVVFNFGTLTTGFDYPELDTIILGRPTNSFALYYQMVGRGVRIHPNKSDCKVIDFCNNVKRFGELENIRYEYIDNYGWALFNDKNELLSNYPMDLERITKKELIASINKKIDNKNDMEMWFGKYKGIKVSQIPMGYAEYIYHKFDFNTAKMKKLELQLKKKLEKNML